MGKTAADRPKSCPTSPVPDVCLEIFIATRVFPENILLNLIFNFQMQGPTC